MGECLEALRIFGESLWGDLLGAFGREFLWKVWATTMSGFIEVRCSGTKWGDNFGVMSLGGIGLSTLGCCRKHHTLGNCSLAFFRQLWRITS